MYGGNSRNDVCNTSKYIFCVMLELLNLSIFDVSCALKRRELWLWIFWIWIMDTVCVQMY